MPPPHHAPASPLGSFSTLFRFLPGLTVLLARRDLRVLDVNDAWAETLGIPRDESVGRPCAELSVLVQPDAIAAICTELEAGRQVIDHPAQLVCRNGEVLETLLCARIVEVGGQTCILAVCRDITAQRRLEQARQEAAEAQRIAEVMFATAFHSSPEAIALSRLADGRLLAVNPAFVALTGWRADAVIGQSALTLGIWAIPEERVALAELVTEHAAVRDFHCSLRVADGSPRDALVNASTVEIAGHTCLISLIRDVTHEKAVAARLHDSQTKFATIFDTAPFALALTRLADRTYIDANPAWERLFGYPRQDIIGRTSRELGCWVDGDDYDAIYTSVVNNDALQKREIRLHPHDRPQTVVSCVVSGRRLQVGGDDCALWSMVDISELRRVQARIEELNQNLERRVTERTAELSRALDILRQTQEELIRREKMAALGSLVAGIAHELNTPIGNSVTVATTFSARTEELLRAYAGGKLRRADFDSYTEDARRAVELLMASLTRAEELVRSFKQVATDQTSELRRPFELNEMLHEMAVTLSPMFKNRQIVLHVVETSPMTLDSFPGALGQIFTNLISNALLHAFDGGGDGRITVTPRRLDADSLEIEFADDGRGIPPADQRRIFDPFFTTRLGQGGTGLGLHIVYNLVTQVLGGRITVHSVPDVGTRFVLTLPCVAPAHSDAASGLKAPGLPLPLNFDDIGPII